MSLTLDQCSTSQVRYPISSLFFSFRYRSTCLPVSYTHLVSAEDMEGVTAQVVTPIICEGDAIGAVVIMSREPRAKFSEGELRLAATAAGFLGRQMES